MTEYPQDVMPLYAQGYSLAEYLIYHGGRRKFVAFLADGMGDGQWSAAVARNYHIQDLPALQNSWVGWVAQGFPPPPESNVMVASAQPPATITPVAATIEANRARPAPNLIYRINDKGGDAAQQTSGRGESDATVRSIAGVSNKDATQNPPPESSPPAPPATVRRRNRFPHKVGERSAVPRRARLRLRRLQRRRSPGRPPWNLHGK